MTRCGEMCQNPCDCNWNASKYHLWVVLLFFFFKGMAHRDLKPENILCECEDKVSLSDLDHFIVL